MSGEVATTPSERFLSQGVPTRTERRAIEVLARRRQFLNEELAGPDDYAGVGYDRREADALAWVLGVVKQLRKSGGLNGRAS